MRQPVATTTSEPLSPRSAVSGSTACPLASLQPSDTALLALARVLGAIALDQTRATQGGARAA